MDRLHLRPRSAVLVSGRSSRWRSPDSGTKHPRGVIGSVQGHKDPISAIGNDGAVLRPV